MAEELSDQAGNLQRTMSFFTVRNEQGRLLSDGRASRGGNAALAATLSGNGRKNTTGGGAVRPGIAVTDTPRPATTDGNSSRNGNGREATGITLAIGETNPRGDVRDRDFEEF